MDAIFKDIIRLVDDRMIDGVKENGCHIFGNRCAKRCGNERRGDEGAGEDSPWSNGLGGWMGNKNNIVGSGCYLSFLVG